MANNYSVTQHSVLQNPGSTVGVVNMTIYPNNGYMIKASDFTIDGAQGMGFEPIPGGNTYHKYELDFSTTSSGIEVTGADDNVVNKVTLENTCQSCVEDGTIGNDISVEVEFANSFDFPSNNVTVKIDFDGDATLWEEPVPTGVFRWILTNKIWPRGSNRAFPNLDEALAQDYVLDVNNDEEPPAFQVTQSILGSSNGNLNWSTEEIQSWNAHEGAGHARQDSYCIENAVIRPVFGFYDGPMGYRSDEYEYNSNYAFTTMRCSDDGQNGICDSTWNSSECFHGASTFSDLQLDGPAFFDNDLVVEKMLNHTFESTPTKFTKIREFTPTNYQVDTNDFLNKEGMPESFQIRFIIHGKPGYECLVENFGVTMHGFTIGNSDASVGGDPWTPPAEGAGNPIYYYGRRIGNGPDAHFKSSAEIWKIISGEPTMLSAGASPWLLDYAVNGYFDYGGGDGEALVGTWLDQRLYASPAVWWKPKSIQITGNNIGDNQGFGSVAGDNSLHALSDAYDIYSGPGTPGGYIGDAQNTYSFFSVGTPFCEEYLGRGDELSSFLNIYGNQVTPYHAIGINDATSIDSTGNQFPFYGQDVAISNFLNEDKTTNRWHYHNYSLQQSSNTTVSPNPVKYVILKQCDHSQISNSGLSQGSDSSVYASGYVLNNSKQIFNKVGGDPLNVDDCGDKFIEVSVVLRDDWRWSSSYENEDGTPPAFFTNIFGKATQIQTPSMLPMPFNVELIDNLSDNNSGTLTITDTRGNLARSKVLNSGFKNQQTVYSISGSSIKGKPKKIATVKIEAGDKKYFTRVANLKVDTLNGGNLKMIPQRNTDSIVSSAGRVTTQIFDVIYTNENQAKKKFRAAVKNKGNKTKAFLNFKETALVNRTRTIKDVSIGGSTLNPNGEIRDIVLHGSPNTSFVITLTDKNEDSIISRSNSTIVNSKGVTIPTLSDVINRRGVYKFKQRFPGLELIRRTAINGSMAASGATRIIFDNLTGVEVGDRVLMSSIGATETTTVTVLNPTGSNANECDVSRSITAADNSVAVFKRPRQYDLNITPSSSLGPNMPTSDPTYTLRHYNDIVLTFKASAGTTYDITHVNSVATGFSGSGEDHSSNYIGKPNKTAAQLENVSYVKKDVTLVYTLNGKGTNAFSVRTPFFSNQAAFVKAGEPYASTPTYFGGGSDWTNTIPAENGGTIVSVRELHTALSADGGTANGICTITIKFDIEKWGTENVTMDLDLDRVLTAS